jgi:hypothetical protein
MDKRANIKVTLAPQMQVSSNTPLVCVIEQISSANRAAE